jgi:hypothetical protein
MNIPKVRTWKVTFIRFNGDKSVQIVDTINKRFAKWIANERAGYPAYDCREIKIALVKQ